MTNTPAPRDDTTLEKARAWLASQVTITVPGWAVVLAGGVALVLLLVALD
jgi:hypothetical protein